MARILDLLPLLVVVLGITFLLFAMARRRESHGQAMAQVDPEQYERLKSRAQKLADDLERIRVDIEGFHREVAARVDNKLVKLDLLVRHADERIEKLRSMGGPGSGPGPA